MEAVKYENKMREAKEAATRREGQAEETEVGVDERNAMLQMGEDTGEKAAQDYQHTIDKTNELNRLRAEAKQFAEDASNTEAFMKEEGMDETLEGLSPEARAEAVKRLNDAEARKDVIHRRLDQYK